MPTPNVTVVSIHGRRAGLYEGLLAPFGMHVGGEGLDGMLVSASPGLTATAGGTQALSAVVPATVARYSVVATAADGATLPRARLGMMIVVANDGANTMQLFGWPATQDTIDGVASATGVPVSAARRSVFYCVVEAVPAQGVAPLVPGAWISLGVAKST